MEHLLWTCFCVCVVLCCVVVYPRKPKTQYITITILWVDYKYKTYKALHAQNLALLYGKPETIHVISNSLSNKKGYCSLILFILYSFSISGKGTFPDSMYTGAPNHSACLRCAAEKLPHGRQVKPLSSGILGNSQHCTHSPGSLRH